ncbi:MFS general substrate transporter [Rhizopus microsporus var. microsporus]|uniref:MFS general substrate transporter n=2 Tax=Rhizopus microsporus TaxID=58291 RepID=A0A2G4T7C0_RHIZD|nr:MFS general substrate transporter [Rhizopus microsporus ATCC 52813]ORE10881.1 MFS general substrate transporter [Rhizopus microsporus var. microsporus]PHZ16913.1 MFS general substrate transporter [Rhizopus microsporus ATCC 52813]
MDFEQTLDEATPLLNGANVKPKVVKEKPSPWYIIVPVFGFAFTLGSIAAPLVEGLTIIFCYKYYQAHSISDSDIPLDQCNIPEVQAIVSRVQAFIMFLSSGSSLLLAGYYGALSDRKGRVTVLKISVIGSIISMASFILTLKYYNIFDVYLIFIGYVIRGLLAGDSVLVSTAQAYISDCTTLTNRTLVFSHMIAALYLGTTLGPSFSSYLIKQTGTIASVFWMVIVIHVTFLIYSTFVLPESKDISEYKEKPNQTFLQRINIFSAISVLFHTSSKHANRWALPIISIIQVLVTVLLIPPTLLYGMLQFGWTAYEGGFFVSVTSFSRLFIMLAVLPLITKLFHKYKPTEKKTAIVKRDAPKQGSSSSSSLDTLQDDKVPSTVSERDIQNTILFDAWLVRSGLSVEIVAFILFGLVNTSTAFIWTGLLQGFAVLAAPGIRSLVSNLSDESQLGKVWGAMATLESFSIIVSQVGINSIYSATVGTMPYFTFFVCAGVSALAASLAFFIYPVESQCDEED